MDDMVAAQRRSASAAAAIRHHYDVGNAFYRLWLDPSLSYSCALWAGPDDTLAAAQSRKLDYHLEAIAANRAKAVLDIGCGWGAVLERLSLLPGISSAVGLTLSDAQARHIRERALPKVRVETQNWTLFETDERFDGIVSIGAFEHFATPRDTAPQKIEAYRHFFSRCRGWLAQDGVLSLQTIAYANMEREQASRFNNEEIFPDADLPTLTEIVTATEGLFEIARLRNDRLDYARTCEAWAHNLRGNSAQARALVGDDVVRRYQRYLKMSSLGFRMGKICLLRLILRPIGSPWSRHHSL